MCRHIRAWEGGVSDVTTWNKFSIIERAIDRLFALQKRRVKATLSKALMMERVTQQKIPLVEDDSSSTKHFHCS
eukprot:6460550-Amphidinium_carterae.1